MSNIHSNVSSDSPVPADAMCLFRMCWQLENWLRTMVYVELRANRVDWETPIVSKVRDWPPRSLSSDKVLHHMATPHQASLSYLTLGQLWDVISSSGNWSLFAPYFPPKENTDVRIAEVKTIRNRVAHFREPHRHDKARLGLFMHDMEAGIRRFCSRYTVARVPVSSSEDTVSHHLEQEWEHIGYGIELMRPHGWLYAPGVHRMHPKMNARLDMLFHKDYAPGSLEGIIYRVTVQPSNDRCGPIDALAILTSTKPVHCEVIHILLSPYQLSATIPAILGTEHTASVVAAFLHAGVEASSNSVQGPLNKDGHDWPEYVLWPDHMLSFFSEDIHEPILESE